MSTITIDAAEYARLRDRNRELEARVQREELLCEILELGSLLRFPLYADMRRWTAEELTAERDKLRAIVFFRRGYIEEQSA